MASEQQQLLQRVADCIARELQPLDLFASIFYDLLLFVVWQFQDPKWLSPNLFKLSIEALIFWKDLWADNALCARGWSQTSRRNGSCAKHLAAGVQRCVQRSAAQRGLGGSGGCWGATCRGYLDFLRCVICSWTC